MYIVMDTTATDYADDLVELSIIHKECTGAELSVAKLTSNRSLIKVCGLIDIENYETLETFTMEDNIGRLNFYNENKDE